ncbi:MAG: dUTP diphosphatase [Janthinobacterium lividum]
MKLDNDRLEVAFLRTADNPDLAVPAYSTAGASGFDLRACIPDDRPLTLEPGCRVLIPIGFAIGLPAGYEMQVRPRSGLAAKHGITVLNSPGTIDWDYRGPVSICLVNLGADSVDIHRGDRIAQGVVAEVRQATLFEVEALDETVRGHGGFGSTGRA